MGRDEESRTNKQSSIIHRPFSTIRLMYSIRSNFAENGVYANHTAPSNKNSHRGGSFLCTDQYCARYISGGRGKGEPETGTNHVGFRLVRNVR